MRIFLAVLLSSAVFAAETNGPAPVIGMLNYIHSTNDLDKTVDFYREVFGFEKPAPARPPNPAVPGLIGVPGAQLRVAMLKIPGSPFNFELTHFGGVELHPAQANHSDPGAAYLVVRVRDIDAIVDAVKKAGAPIVTRSGAPININEKVRAILFRDPDGYIVEAVQGPVPADAPAGNVIGASMSLTVSDMEATRHFYNDLLGFDLTGKKDYIRNPAILDLGNEPAGSEFLQMAGRIPGTKASIELHAWKGLKVTPFRLRVADPGCPAIALHVTDLDGLLKTLKEANVKVVSIGGVPQQFGPGVRNIFVEDPDGFKIELFQSQ